MLLVVSIYLLLVVVLPIVVSLLLSWRALPEGRACPACGSETVRLLRRWLERVPGRRRAGTIQRRWCTACGWEGHARVRGAESQAPGEPGASDKSIEVRELEVDGRPWRVSLRFWNDGRRWYGQLLFSAPSGRLWADGEHLLSGATPDEILAQVLLLPEADLAGRLREVTEKGST